MSVEMLQLHRCEISQCPEDIHKRIHIKGWFMYCMQCVAGASPKTGISVRIFLISKLTGFLNVFLVRQLKLFLQLTPV